jgi:hypothetical protein
MIFVPTEEHKKVRRQARDLYDRGFRLVGEWCRKIPALTLSVWAGWESQAGFLVWWSELFPEHGEVTLADLKAMEFEANRCIMTALGEGDLSAAQLVLKMVTAARAAKTAEDSSLGEWFAATERGNGWVAEA